MMSAGLPASDATAISLASAPGPAQRGPDLWSDFKTDLHMGLPGSQCVSPASAPSVWPAHLRPFPTSGPLTQAGLRLPPICSLRPDSGYRFSAPCVTLQAESIKTLSELRPGHSGRTPIQQTFLFLNFMIVLLSTSTQVSSITFFQPGLDQRPDFYFELSGPLQRTLTWPASVLPEIKCVGREAGIH